MGSANHPVQNKGLFHNLPTFSPEVKGLTALVTGANGMSGFHTLRVLLESPERWTKIWAVSRRPPPKEMMALLTPAERAGFEHIAIDFLQDPGDIAKVLKERGVSADYVFFYSYAQPMPDKTKPLWSNAQELLNINASLLRNFLGALDHANIVPKRVLLQTGAKHYGIHLGPARTPFLESDPRVKFEPNFYYAQEDILFEYCKSHGVGWNVIRPAVTIGAVTNAAMNPLYPYAVYAAVQAHKREKLDFPGNLGTWLWPGEHSTAKFTSYLSEWAILEDKCRDQAFNASDGSPLPHNRLWPELARWYGAPGWNIPVFDQNKITTVDPGRIPTPLGYGPGSKTEFAWSFCDWAGRPENPEAWKEIMTTHGLTHDPFDDIQGCFAVGDVVAFRFLVQLSMNKARSFGWTGHVDTLETVYQTFSELNKLGMLPLLVGDSRPMT